MKDYSGAATDFAEELARTLYTTVISKVGDLVLISAFQDKNVSRQTRKNQ